MKVGIVTDPMDTGSSVRIYLTNLVENLSKVYDPKKIYLIHSRESENPLYRKTREIIIRGFYRDNFPSASIADLARPFALRKYDLDVVHYTHSNPPLTFFATGSKNVCLITTVGPLTHPQCFPWPSRYIARVLRSVNRRMDSIITESESEKRDVVRFLRVPQQKVEVIPSGVDDIYRPMSNLDEIKGELSAKYRIEYPFILNVGTYRPIKNGPNLIRAFARLKSQGLEHKLVLAGKAAQRFNEVQGLVRELGLESEVISTGFVPRQDLPGLYNTASVFVLPSFKESFGHVLVEAMASGCPVVTSNVTCMPEVVGDASVLVDPYDANSIAAGIHRVLSDAELRADLRARGLKRAKLYSWERCARDTLKVYQRLCGTRRQGG